MDEFDERWQRLVASARRADKRIEPLSLPRVRALAALARTPPARRSERRSLVALAALLACVLFALVPAQAQVREFLKDARAELAALPSHIPRPPHLPPAALALEALPDLRPFSTE